MSAMADTFGAGASRAPRHDRLATRLLRALRSARRAAAILAATAAYYAVFLAGDLLLARSPKRRAWRDAAFGEWARTFARIANMRVTVRGRAPRPPFLLVANHLSYVDIVTLTSTIDCTYVARGDLAGWPALGRICRSMGVLFLDRERRADVTRVGRAIAEALDAGHGVVLFPEGTSTAGASVGPFRSSLLEPAAAGRLPVHYASLRYTTPAGEPPASLAVCWWGDMTFGRHLLDLLALKGFSAEIVFGDEPIAGGDRKRLAAELHDAVSRQFRPLPQEEA